MSKKVFLEVDELYKKGNVPEDIFEILDFLEDMICRTRAITKKYPFMKRLAEKTHSDRLKEGLFMEWLDFKKLIDFFNWPHLRFMGYKLGCNTKRGRKGD